MEPGPGRGSHPFDGTPRFEPHRCHQPGGANFAALADEQAVHAYKLQSKTSTCSFIFMLRYMTRARELNVAHPIDTHAISSWASSVAYS